MNNEKLKIPLSLTSAGKLVSKYADADNPDEALDEMVRAADAMTASAKAISHSVEVIMRNRMATEVANAKAASNKAFQQFESAARKYDKTRARTEAVVAALETEIAPPKPRDAAEIMSGGEMRTMIRSLPDSERKALLSEADDSVVAAIAHSHPKLSGVTESERDLAVMQWKKRRHPAELERIRRLRAGLDQLDRLSVTFSKWALELANDQADEIRAAEDSERAAKAALEAAG